MSHIMPSDVSTMLQHQNYVRQQVFVDAEAVAEDVIRTLTPTASIHENDLISIVCNSVGCRRPDAAYAVNSLCSRGVIVKDWATGMVQRGNNNDL